MNTFFHTLISGFFTILLVAACNSQSSQESDTELRVMSYNLRFDNPDDGVNAWDNRKDRVANLIKFYEPVFIGTQEGLLHQLEYLEKELDGYEWIGVGRDDGTMSGEFSALFYDTARVELIEGSEQTFWLSETPSEPSKSWDAALPRIVTYGAFRDRQSAREFFVFNTHFDHIGDTARANSAELIVNRIKKETADKPVILTGDFNATPDSRPYSILTADDSGLFDAFEVTNLPHTGPLFTFEGFEVKSGIDRRRIDYIFANDGIDVNKHAIISSFRGDFYPSDHLPVIADVKLGD